VFDQKLTQKGRGASVGVANVVADRHKDGVVSRFEFEDQLERDEVSVGITENDDSLRGRGEGKCFAALFAHDGA
jgi:hypothetical protein